MLVVPLHLLADPPDYSLRLSVTEKENKGFLEVSLSGEWLQVSADGYWELSSADAICSELGFQYATSAIPAIVIEGQYAYPGRRNFTTLRCWVSEGKRVCNSSASLRSDGRSEKGRPLEIQCNGRFT